MFILSWLYHDCFTLKIKVVGYFGPCYTNPDRLQHHWPGGVHYTWLVVQAFMRPCEVLWGFLTVGDPQNHGLKYKIV